MKRKSIRITTKGMARCQVVSDKRTVNTQPERLEPGLPTETDGASRYSDMLSELLKVKQLLGVHLRRTSNAGAVNIATGDCPFPFSPLSPLCHRHQRRTFTSKHGKRHSLRPTAVRSQFRPMPVHASSDILALGPAPPAPTAPAAALNIVPAVDSSRGSNQWPLLESRKQRSDQ